MPEDFNRLRGFESRELVEAYFHGLHGRSLSAANSRSIVSSFRQGRMLFESASTTEPLARPITQFYSVSAIARGTAMVLSRHGSEGSLRRGHGLKIGTFADDAKDLELEVTKGLFDDFSTALGGGTYRVRTAGPDWYLPLPRIDPGTTLVLGAAAGLLPALARELRQWTGTEPPPTFALEGLTTLGGDPGELEWEFTGSHADEQLYSVFGSSAARTKGNGLIATDEDDTAPQLAQSFVFEKVGHVLLRSPIASTARLSPLQTLFVVSFALSMLARYRPSQWMAVIGGGGGDSMFPFVQSFLDLNQSWFPLLAADHLQHAAKCDY